MVRKLIPDKQSEKLNYSEFAVHLEVINKWINQIQGYSGSDIKLVCKEAAMKPLRRLMKEIESVTNFENINWSVQADPRTLPSPGPVTNDDLNLALSTTKSSAQAVKFDKYEKWMAEFGSV